MYVDCKICIKNMKKKIMILKNICNLITLPHVNYLFDHMLKNSLVNNNMSLITKRDGELAKFL
jgi:hypothetical protein